MLAHNAHPLVFTQTQTHTHTHGNTRTLTHSLTLTYTHTHIRSNVLTHTHTHTHTHSLTLTLTHSSSHTRTHTYARMCLHTRTRAHAHTFHKEQPKLTSGNKCEWPYYTMLHRLICRARETGNGGAEKAAQTVHMALLSGKTNTVVRVTRVSEGVQLPTLRAERADVVTRWGQWLTFSC